VECDARNALSIFVICCADDAKVEQDAGRLIFVTHTLVYSYDAKTTPMADRLSVWLVRRLEFPARQLVESDYWWEQFQTISEDVSVCNVLMHSPH